jgi:hypothetical protein
MVDDTKATDAAQVEAPIAVEGSAQRAGRSFLPTVQFTLADDLSAQAIWADFQRNHGSGPYPAVLLQTKSADIGTLPHGHLAIWVDRSFDGGVTWNVWMDLTARTGQVRPELRNTDGSLARQASDGAPGMYMGWDGRGCLVEVTIATSVDCEIGVGYKLGVMG